MSTYQSRVTAAHPHEPVVSVAHARRIVDNHPSVAVAEEASCPCRQPWNRAGCPLFRAAIALLSSVPRATHDIPQRPVYVHTPLTDRPDPAPAPRTHAPSPHTRIRRRGGLWRLLPFSKLLLCTDKST